MSEQDLSQPSYLKYVESLATANVSDIPSQKQTSLPKTSDQRYEEWVYSSRGSYTSGGAWNEQDSFYQPIIKALEERNQRLVEGIIRYLQTCSPHIAECWVNHLMEIGDIDFHPPYDFKAKAALSQNLPALEGQPKTYEDNKD